MARTNWRPLAQWRFWKALPLTALLLASACTETAKDGAQGEQGPAGPKGDPGAPGLRGEQGPPGPAGGPQGDMGLSTLARTTPEAAGANCATGGMRLEVGADADRDGTMDVGEEDAAQTRYLCNGPQGPQGIQGARGLQGEQGPQGVQGLRGEQGPVGPAGARSAAATHIEAAGANCAMGGVRLEFGTDTNGNGTLDADADPPEVNAALTRYVCNGAQGPQGLQGIQGLQGERGERGERGAQGPQGPQGVSGAEALYGDGAGGALNIPYRQVVDLSSSGGLSYLNGRHHLQFTDVNIAGTLVVPSGTVIRTTGNFTIQRDGQLYVYDQAEDSAVGMADKGIARSPAGEPQGGRGIGQLQATQLLRPGLDDGGGAGARPAGVTNLGEGGGSLVILAKGTIQVQPFGSIYAPGENGASGVANTPGGGGGAGGVVVLLGRAGIVVDGRIFAVGGRGGHGGTPASGGPGKGGGGGGGGGIIHLMTAGTITTNGTVDVSPGAGGTSVAGSTFVQPGGGGGACGGNGGDGSNSATAPNNVGASGLPGHNLRTVTPNPESLFL